MMGAVLAALQSRTQAGTPQGSAPGQQAQGAGDQYSQMVSSLKGADPGGLLRQVNSLKQITAAMLVQNLERLPNVSSKLAKLIPMWDAVIKEIQQAANVDGAVRNPTPPIQMGAAQPGSPDSGIPMGGGGGMIQ